MQGGAEGGGGSVAIIGAGPSGLAAAKAALEEGLRRGYGEGPSVFEKSGGVGGLWRASEGKVWDSLRTNLSKYTCAFSDFPWPEEAETFPKAREVCRYLERFAESLQPHLHLHCEVTSVSRGQDGETSGWQLAWREAGEPKQQHFRHLVVASGIFEKAHLQLPGLETFPGLLRHAADYRKPEEFAGKKVLVVGSAFSGADIAVDLSSCASVTVAGGKPMWYIPRYVNGVPADLAFYSRKPKPKQTPEESNRQRHQFLSGLAQMPEALTAPSDWTRPPFVCISDHFADAVRTGAVSVAGTVSNVTGSTVHFADGRSEEFEALLVATGYDLDLPFLVPELKKAVHLERDQLQPLILSHCTWPPEEFPGLAFVGIYRGPYFAVLELQARWACGVFSGRLRAPTEEERRESLDRAWALRAGEDRPQFPQSYVDMAEELADLVGVHPRELESPSHPLHHLYPDVLEGPLLPFHYRLVGFGAHPSVAERAIRECRKALARDARM
ncbi:FMO5 [Symbiodinium natans]|uniref:FMO5 protein n=1 Tax=Symbiodinium natans TaxID=878477 RepID=A0A812MNS4_9DINO|nr:FMO5 [Symbiodinium natans]